MKVRTNSIPAFRPVVITLENAEEVSLMACILDCDSGQSLIAYMVEHRLDLSHGLKLNMRGSFLSRGC